MAKIKAPHTRGSGFSGSKSYMQYLECLKNRYNAVDGTFYNAIKIYEKCLRRSRLNIKLQISDDKTIC
jgi:hypothetical protein